MQQRALTSGAFCVNMLPLILDGKTQMLKWLQESGYFSSVDCKPAAGADQVLPCSTILSFCFSVLAVFFLPAGKVLFCLQVQQ